VYAPEHETASFDGVEIRRDLRYGPHERHRLDVFTGADADGEPRPVVVFVHGGNFVGGDKARPGSPFYDNVGLWAVRQGFVGVTMSYRLAPEVGHPAGADDVAAAVRLVRECIHSYGGDPERVVLVGASAGAVHVGSHLAAHPGPASGVAGAALLSGLYDLPAFGGTAVLEAYYGPGADLAAVSPIAGLSEAGIPLLVAVTEHDPPDHHRQWLLLAGAVQARSGRLPHMVYLPGHNHFSEVLHLGTEDDGLGRQLAHFVVTAAPATST
jgi:acetyl esterase/lipase